MPGTYSNVVLHVVFSTKDRRPFIEPHVQSRLYGVDFDPRYVFD
ncbi:MAG TPA: hypothetical protein P5081_01895 [Phycisphaerae bacterium]|nr:hypothetical protein [Phycisphaerae bacterium]HRW51607.1 hypothetical protein [Phycisphaerae bacterium]